MAAAFLRRIGNDEINVLSAGSEPAAVVNPVVVTAMHEVGVDIRNETPHAWTDRDFQDADLIVTMGCGDSCPSVAGKRYVEWSLDDPAGRDLAAVRRIRNDVEKLVTSLRNELLDTDS